MVIRPQYHFRDGPNGLHAWDVRKLAAFAAELPVVDIPLADIGELDETYWYEHAQPTTRSVAVHAAQIEAADLKYPIILCADGRLMDGMHRVAKAYMLGLESIKATRLPHTPEPDYVGVAPDDLPYEG
ncbi:hypothetical protein SAMN05444287_2794 [Octadecabacter temperatus]|uniref:Uncharacterized protein n=1 Tax=Octadecabacter temperatus TaxID=1458307 RepID=A0A0K0Y9K2_9RHOB|nr:hypothetical protein [Octadecabacter temperatus]AKS47552.1 hypothetical protein OSB_30360 [Octadecabacter temperatus]SIO41368.1 hypothetical protein SAMN05444287_2794 [Octadecabacter temperatus]